MNEENMAALAALQAQATGTFTTSSGATMSISLCPHCQQGFGSASIGIHVRRCRALLPDPGELTTELNVPKSVKKRRVPALVDLCLTLITRNFQGLCIDKVKSAPEHEAALLASLPLVLIHRIIINLVYENKQISDKVDTHLTTIRIIQREMDEMKQQRAHLEGFRNHALLYRQSSQQHEQTIERLRRELTTTTQELVNARHHNTHLSSQFKNFEKAQLRQDARVAAQINSLVAENEKLRQDVREALQREKNAFKRLASLAVSSSKPIARGCHVPKAGVHELPNNLPSTAAHPSKQILEMAALLPHTVEWMRNALDIEEQKHRENRKIIAEVHGVLDGMVYDVETCENECEIARLRHDLSTAKEMIFEMEQREYILIQERQAAYEFATRIEQEGRDMVERFNENLLAVMRELSKKDLLEKELIVAKDQLHLSAQISKELAKAEREICDLRRKHNIQNLRKTSTSRTSSDDCRMSSGYAAALKHMKNLDQKGVPSVDESRTRTLAVSDNQLDAVLPADAFTNIPDNILMNIFAHLEANSVFSVSLSSKALLSRVHVMFGMPVSSTTKSVGNGIPSSKSRTSSIMKPTKTTRSQSYATDKERAQQTQLAKAELIVKSLKKDEIKLFHDMSIRVKTLESHLGHLQAEKEDVAARLQSAESVRDFLMEKLKDLECRFVNLNDVIAKKEEQAVMDREIIGFLDAKAHEYESTLRKTGSQNEAYRVELARVKEEEEAKMIIVNDMIQLLTDEKKDLEVQLRSQRKVLVREVKNLRAQNEELMVDKQQYFNQLKHLKLALQHLDEL